MPSQATPPREPRLSRGALGRHCFYQPQAGYRFSIDSVLLAGFAGPASGAVADLGAGCGVLCVLLAARGIKGPFTAVELDPDAAHCAKLNFEAAGLDGSVLGHDLAQEHPALRPGGFALAMSNPPFTRRGHGRVPPDPARARARHELSLGAPLLMARAARLLTPGGRFALCAPPARLDEMICELTAAGLRPKRLRLVHGREGKPASLALIEAVRGGRPHLRVEPPLLVHGRGQAYSPEAQAIFDELCGPASAPA